MVIEIKLVNPLMIDGQLVKTLTADPDKLTGNHFALAEALKNQATNSKGKPSISAAIEFDYTMQMYLGMMAVVAENPGIDPNDLERITGVDLMAFAGIGRNFILRKSDDSTDETSDAPTETTPELSTLL